MSVDLVPPRLSVFPPGRAPPARDICEGWVLKKRRKKMQGFARRYFTLKPDGVLVYSTHPGQTPRDSIPLQLATITSSERSHSITVDSGTKTFHIRCASPTDFQKWMTAFRTFLVEPDEQDDTATEVGEGSSIANNFSDRLLSVVQDMDKQIHDLETALSGSASEFGEQDSSSANTTLNKKKSAAHLKSSTRKDEKEKDSQHRHGHGKGEHGILGGLFHRKTSGHSTPTNESLSPSSPSLSTSSNPSTPSSATFTNLHPQQSSSMSHQASSSSSSSSLISNIQALRASHSTLVSLLENIPFEPQVQRSGAASLSTHGHRTGSHTPTPSTQLGLRTTGSGMDRFSSTPSPSPRSVKSHASFRRHMRPLSLSTVGSIGGDEGSVWFDADDGDGGSGLEFIDADVDAAEQGDRSKDSDSDEEVEYGDAVTSVRDIRIEQHDANEPTTPTTPVASPPPPHVLLTPDSPPPFSPSSSSTLTRPSVSDRPKLSSVLSDVSSSSTISLGPSPPSPKEEKKGAVSVERRKRLPAPTSGEQMSLFTMLKRNIGKDLATVAFPVSFNEPLSLLQHTAEDLEYIPIIEKAIAESDPVIRLAYVAAFAVSGYACTKLRASRKPFNPLLGETFEDARYNFVSEKVSHHPPVVAAHAHGDGWEWWCTSSAKNKFWGKSLEIIPVGTTYLKIGDETYSWQKPSSFMRNLIAGEKYLEHCGFMTINTTSSHSLHCTLEFKEGGFWGTNKDEVFGKIGGGDSSNADVELRGRWTTGLSRLLDPSGNHLHVLWRANPLPDDALAYYGFTHFAIGLNDPAPDEEWIPSTDSRLRPDQRALEFGDVERAERDKARVEEAQRERRKARAERGEEWEPKWFKPKEGQAGEWEYKGGYWEARDSRSWGELERLW